MKDSVEVEALNEALNRTDTPNTSKESQLARLYYRNGKIFFYSDLLKGGYWIFHKNQVDMATVYQAPEEKLWYVIKHYHGNREITSNSKSGSGGGGNGQRNGLRLEKNDIVKFGRVRLRVRDIDYAEKEKPINLNNSQAAGGTGARRAT